MQQSYEEAKAELERALAARKFLVFVEGREADAGRLDDYGEAKAVIVGGEHTAHMVKITSHKHNCGAYGTEIECSCGASWQSAMYGCWQQNHQREESGDETLSDMMTLAYTALWHDTPYIVPIIHEVAKGYTCGRVPFTAVEKAAHLYRAFRD